MISKNRQPKHIPLNNKIRDYRLIHYEWIL